MCPTRCLSKCGTIMVGLSGWAYLTPVVILHFLSTTSLFDHVAIRRFQSLLYYSLPLWFTWLGLRLSCVWSWVQVPTEVKFSTSPMTLVDRGMAKWYAIHRTLPAVKNGTVFWLSQMPLCNFIFRREGCCCWRSVRHLALDVGHIVGPLNYSRCDTKHRLPCTITPFY